MVNPLVIVVPAGLAVGLYFALRQPSTPAYATPPPGTPASGNNGPRYQSYMQQLQAAQLAYSAGSLFDKSATSAAAQQFRGTLDVVGQMAAADQRAGSITISDLNNINNQIAAFKKTIG